MADDQAVKWLRAQEAADVLGVSRRTVRSWSERFGIRHKTLPTGERRYHPDDVQELARKMESGVVGAIQADLPPLQGGRSAER
jgi:excisionase family DNA binding protein